MLKVVFLLFSSESLNGCGILMIENKLSSVRQVNRNLSLYVTPDQKVWVNKELFTLFTSTFGFIRTAMRTVTTDIASGINESSFVSQQPVAAPTPGGADVLPNREHTATTITTN